MTAEGIRPLESEVRAVRDFPQAKSLRKLRDYFGLLNFHRRFLPNIARVIQSFTDLLSSAQGPSTPLKSTSAVDEAFQTAKSILADALLLVHSLADAPMRLITDASGAAVGAVPQQFQHDSWCLLGSFFHELKPTETRCSTLGRELLAVYLSIRRTSFSCVSVTERRGGMIPLLYTCNRPKRRQLCVQKLQIGRPVATSMVVCFRGIFRETASLF